MFETRAWLILMKADSTHWSCLMTNRDNKCTRIANINDCTNYLLLHRRLGNKDIVPWLLSRGKHNRRSKLIAEILIHNINEINQIIYCSINVILLTVKIIVIITYYIIIKKISIRGIAIIPPNCYNIISISQLFHLSNCSEISTILWFIISFTLNNDSI